jgi:hypothetical protein
MIDAMVNEGVPLELISPAKSYEQTVKRTFDNGAKDLTLE